MLVNYGTRASFVALLLAQFSEIGKMRLGTLNLGPYFRVTGGLAPPNFGNQKSTNS